MASLLKRRASAKAVNVENILPQGDKVWEAFRSSAAATAAGGSGIWDAWVAANNPPVNISEDSDATPAASDVEAVELIREKPKAKAAKAGARGGGKAPLAADTHAVLKKISAKPKRIVMKAIKKAKPKKKATKKAAPMKAMKVTKKVTKTVTKKVTKKVMKATTKPKPKATTKPAPIKAIKVIKVTKKEAKKAKVARKSMVAMKSVLAMKSMVAMKSVLAMKKIPMKVGRPPAAGKGRAFGIRARAMVMAGRKSQTQGRLGAKDLKKNRYGLWVSTKASEAAKVRSGGMMNRWGDAVKKARAELGITGWVPVGGTSKVGKRLYTRTKQHYDAAKLAALV